MEVGVGVKVKLCIHRCLRPRNELPLKDVLLGEETRGDPRVDAEEVNAWIHKRNMWIQG